MIGKTLKNRYEIIKFLAKGGFGETYLAKDLDYPKHPFRVVKMLRPQTNDPQALQIARDLFKREAEVLSELGKNDLIPELYAYFEDNNEFYLVQEYIEGTDLTKEIYAGNKLNETEVIQLLNDILTALKPVHENNVIHRDLKPANLMRCHQNQKIVLIDFGGVKQIATTLQNTPQRTIIIGTPGYYSPEQSQGFPTLASDIYAVGIIAIQALTGQFPIPQDWENKVKITPNLLNILRKMIASDPQKRYQNATETLTAINPLIHFSSSLQTKTITIIPTILSLPKTKSWIWKIGLASMAIAIFLSVFSLKFNSPIPPDNSPQPPPPGWKW